MHPSMDASTKYSVPTPMTRWSIAPNLGLKHSFYCTGVHEIILYDGIIHFKMYANYIQVHVEHVHKRTFTCITRNPRATYLTIPNPKLTIMTSILAIVRFRQDTSSANITAPLTVNHKIHSIIQRDIYTSSGCVCMWHGTCMYNGLNYSCFQISWLLYSYITQIKM